MPVAIKNVFEKLTAIIEPSEGVYVATCPELDLATEGNTPDEALDDLIYMAVDYAEHYMEEFELFNKSYNRAAHKPYTLEIHEKRTKERSGLEEVKVPRDETYTSKILPELEALKEKIGQIISDHISSITSQKLQSKILQKLQGELFG